MTNCVKTNSNLQSGLPVLALLGATLIWGSTFFVTKDLLAKVPTFDLLGIRFFVAGLVAAIIFFPKLRKADARSWRLGAVLGSVFAIAQFAQTWFLQFTSASVSGFITGLSVVITPLLLWAMTRVHIPLPTWIAVGIATVGLAVLSLNGFAMGFGEAGTLLGAVFFGLHIVLVGRWAGGVDPIVLTATQLIVAGIWCTAFALPGGVVIPTDAISWAHIAYLALFASIGAVGLQAWAQSRISADRAAIILTLEPVLAAGLAVLFGGESVTDRLLIGGALIVISMIVAEFGIKIVIGVREAAGQTKPVLRKAKSLAKVTYPGAAQVLNFRFGATRPDGSARLGGAAFARARK